MPCKAEIPGFIDLQKKYGGRGLQIIGLSVDDSAGTAKKYAGEMKMNYPVLLAEGTEEILKAYDPIPSIPVSVVIGRDGRICSKHVGIAPMDVFEKEIASLFCRARLTVVVQAFRPAVCNATLQVWQRRPTRRKPSGRLS